MLFHVSNSLLIHRENTVLTAGFDSHVGNGESVIHGQIGDTVSHEFHRLVQCAVHTDHADDM